MSNISITNNNGGISPVDPDIEFLQGNDGLNVGPNPTTHILLLLGDNTQGIDVSGNPVTYTTTITALDATELQKGVVLLASNAETIAGTDTTKATTPDDIKAKLGAQTLHGIPYGNATTGAIQWLAEATDGQIPIGDTGGVPVLGNITSLDSSITVTNGAGTIDLSVVGSLSGTATSINGSTEDLITIPLGASAACYRFTFNIAGRDTVSGDSVGYSLEGTVKTDGATASVVATPFTDNDEDASLLTASIDLVSSVNNAILQVTGVTAKTIVYKSVGNYVVV